MHWHPTTGEPKIFHDHETVPGDWLDYHPADVAKAPAQTQAPSGEKPMTKAELTEALKAGGIQFNTSDTAAVLAEKLVAALRTVLDIHKVPYDQNDGPRKLLSMVSG
jgi:hypothetical protein